MNMNLYLARPAPVSESTRMKLVPRLQERITLIGFTRRSLLRSMPASALRCLFIATPFRPQHRDYNESDKVLMRVEHRSRTSDTEIALFRTAERRLAAE